MSSYEYNDMFLECQDNAPYHVFTFDIVNSKKMDNNSRRVAQEKLISLALLNYKVLEYVEKIRNRKILVRPFDDKRQNGVGFSQIDKEPVVIGNLTYFTVFRDSISRDEVIRIFEFCKSFLDIDFEFHYADGYYETNDWTLGHTKYFRGYCIDTLSNLHKPYNKLLRKKLNKKLVKN